MWKVLLFSHLAEWKMANSDFPPILSWNASNANIAGILIKTIINILFLRIVLENFQVIIQNISNIVCSLIRFAYFSCWSFRGYKIFILIIYDTLKSDIKLFLEQIWNQLHINFLRRADLRKRERLDVTRNH